LGFLSNPESNVLNRLSELHIIGIHAKLASYGEDTHDNAGNGKDKKGNKVVKGDRNSFFTPKDK